MRMILIQQDTSEIKQKAKFWAGPRVLPGTFEYK